MTPVLDLLIVGEPLSKARPRVTSHGTYTPKTTREAEKAIADKVREVLPGREADPTGRYRLEVTFNSRTRHRRDVDNMVKLVSDALTGIVWADDEQIDQILAMRVRPTPTGSTRVLVSELAS